MLQVTVWGDYSRTEGKKVFMGVTQIMLDDLDLSNIGVFPHKLLGRKNDIRDIQNKCLKRKSAF